MGLPEDDCPGCYSTRCTCGDECECDECEDECTGDCGCYEEPDYELIIERRRDWAER